MTDASGICANPSGGRQSATRDRVIVGRPDSKTRSARVVETHISVLFFVDDKVYKLRKPVQFGFLDFRDREERRTDCEREVVLNRRLAPDVYLGVADVVIEGDPIDHMVVMRRMPDDRRLAFLARQGGDLSDCLREVAEVMAAFHRMANRSPEIAAAGTGDALRTAWEADFAETEHFVGPILDEDVETEIRSLAMRFILGRRTLLESRIAAGRVCDGHGDLQAEDIFCLDDGVRIIDCIEFSDELRYCDVIADVAFLAMDLERLGRPDCSTQFVLDYEQAAGERLPRSLFHLYCASRAYVRAKVACLRVEQGTDASRIEASELQGLALVHLRRARVSLVVIGGPPGSGKSTLAAGIARARDWVVLRTDQIRAERETGPATSDPRFQAGRYSPAATALVYEEMFRRAEPLLEQGKSVVLDASWIDDAWRRAARVLADRTSSDLVELRCEVDPEEGAARIVQRLSKHADVSEATPEVSEAMRRSMDSWESAVVIDTSGKTAEEGLALALETLPPA